MAKDLFSAQANEYARYRPRYPEALYRHILSFVERREEAWDCATGNGQAAVGLSPYFRQVTATDFSAGQLAAAEHRPNIRYLQLPAEKTPFPDASFDLITVATAYHWLDQPLFCRECKRVGRPGAVVAVWAYFKVDMDDPELQELIRYFYQQVVGPFWEPERRQVDEAYQTIHFPFEPLPSGSFCSVMDWDRTAYTGYLRTWSSVQKYERETGRSPLPLIEKELARLWPDGIIRQIRFPLALRLGRIVK